MLVWQLVLLYSFDLVLLSVGFRSSLFGYGLERGFGVGCVWDVLLFVVFSCFSLGLVWCWFLSRFAWVCCLAGVCGF